MRSRPTAASFPLSPQPLMQIFDQQGKLAPTPWSQASQMVSVVLLAPIGLVPGAAREERQDLLFGNTTASAPQGIAQFTDPTAFTPYSVDLFTDLEIHIVGVGDYQLRFQLPSAWSILPLASSAFDVSAGPSTQLVSNIEPSITGTTFDNLAIQPIVAQSDFFGNRNADAPPVDVVVRVTRTASDSTPIGYRGGEVLDGVVKTIDGVATFTNVQVLGLGSWDVHFEAFLNFRTTTTLAAAPLVLSQL
ncbi:hypothetical protein T484DRAFT_1828041 [Baffinella frigidus]|nr:hypothetical protein T484DRAFT_1828041 [Cryptophyta sp. CCMP2293]